MTSPSEPIAVDWQAAEAVAAGLGLRTRSLIAKRDADEAADWALVMSRENDGVRAISYYELAVLLGHRDTRVTAGASLDWGELLQAVETLAGTIRAKVAAENAAAAAAVTLASSSS